MFGRIKTVAGRPGFAFGLAGVAMILALGQVIGTTSMVNAQSKGPIRIAENDWTGQLVDINLAKIILEEHMGFDVDLVFADYTGRWSGLAAGDLDVAMEIWPSYSIAAHEEWIDEKKKVEVVGDLGVVGSGGWFVPTYVIKGDPERGIEPMAPDLKSHKDLNKYANLFARPETGDKGFLLDAIASWETQNEGRIANLGLNYVNVYAGTEGALIAEVDAAYARGEPILFYAWAPHWMYAKYDLTEIELPEYSDACYGVDPDVEGTFACDFPAEALYNVARVGFKDESPKVYQFIKNMNLTTAEQQKVIFLVDVEKMNIEQAVRAWMADNEKIWRAWIPEGV
jgi:glycine betaine/proline transport system substrate-binding protein